MSIAPFVVYGFFVENEVINLKGAIMLVVILTILVFAAVFYAFKIDYKTGVYERLKCGEKIN